VVPLKLKDWLRGARTGALPFFIELFLIAWVSLASGYEMQQPGYVVDFDIATMLTPFGIAANFLADESRLRPFYFRAPHRDGIFEQPWLAVAVFAASGFALFLLYSLRRSLASPPRVAS
jgi:hypothetical protein